VILKLQNDARPTNSQLARKNPLRFAFPQFFINHFFNIGKPFSDMLNIINHTARTEPPEASGRPVLLAQSFKIRDGEGEI